MHSTSKISLGTPSDLSTSPSTSPRISPRPSPPPVLSPAALPESKTDSIVQSLLQSHSAQNNMIAFLTQELEHQRQENALLRRQLAGASQYLNSVKPDPNIAPFVSVLPPTMSHATSPYSGHVSSVLGSQKLVNIPAPIPASQYAAQPTTQIKQSIVIPDGQQTSPLPKTEFHNHNNVSNLEVANFTTTVIPDQVPGSLTLNFEPDEFDFNDPISSESDPNDLFSLLQSVNLTDQILQ